MRHLLLFLLLLVSSTAAQESALDRVIRTGVLRIGTTADYRPFTYRTDGTYDGFDVRLARLIANELGTRIEFVPTTWKRLVPDLRSGKFDLAVGGVTRTLERAQVVGFTIPTLIIGKCPLVRRTDSQLYGTRIQIDQPEVRIAVNPGGTNERYVRAHFTKARIIVVPDNLAIPDLVADGRADVMITDNVEAILAAHHNPRLAALSADNPWTKESLGLMTAREDQSFLNWLNLFLHQVEIDGRLEQLRKEFHLTH